MNQLLFEITKVISAICEIAEAFPLFLRERVKEYSLDFLASFSFENYKSSLLYLRSIRALLKVATNLGYLRFINYEVLISQLEKIKDEIFHLRILATEQKEPDLTDYFKEKEREVKINEMNLEGLNRRQKEILFFIAKNKGEAKISEILETFEAISSRTIRYDLQNLCLRNYLERIGEGRGALYRLKKIEKPSFKEPKGLEEFPKKEMP